MMNMNVPYYFFSQTLIPEINGCSPPNCSDYLFFEYDGTRYYFVSFSPSRQC